MKQIQYLLFTLVCLTAVASCRKNEPIIAIPIDPVVVPCDPNKVCLIYPLNHSTDISRTTEFVWHKFNDITQYEFQLSPSIDFPVDSNYIQMYCNYELVSDTFCSPQRYNGGLNYYLLSNRMYYWRVRGIGATGDTTMWSDVHDFRAHDLRNELSGDYNVAEIRWDYDYPWPYDEDSTGFFYTARISKSGDTGLFVEILGKGLSWEMIRINDLSYKEDTQSWHYAYAAFYIGAIGPGFIPGSEINIRDANRGNNPGYHYGGEYYRGYRH